MYQHPKYESIKAEVYLHKNDVYYVKIWFAGLKISGITVRPSKKEEEMWVQMPMYRSKDGKFHRYVEFEEEHQPNFREVFEDVARRVADDYKYDR